MQVNVIIVAGIIPADKGWFGMAYLNERFQIFGMVVWTKNFHIFLVLPVRKYWGWQQKGLQF